MLDGFTDKIYQIFKELILSLLRLFPKTEEKGTLPKSFYEASITLIPKPDKDTTKKENHRLVALTNTEVKIFNKTANQIHIDRMTHHDQVEIYS